MIWEGKGERTALQTILHVSHIDLGSKDFDMI